jgi:hypothetical protein
MIFFENSIVLKNLNTFLALLNSALAFAHLGFSKSFVFYYPPNFVYAINNERYCQKRITLSLPTVLASILTVFSMYILKGDGDCDGYMIINDAILI